MAIELASDDVDTQLAEMERLARAEYQQQHTTRVELGPWEMDAGQFVVCRISNAKLKGGATGPRCTWLVNWKAVGRNEVRGILRRGRS